MLNPNSNKYDIDMSKTIVLDCGKNYAAYYNPADDSTGRITHEELLDIHNRFNLDSEWTIVGEYSHFGCERGDFSLSQPFVREQLLSWYNELSLRGIKLLLFPQKSTPRACSYSGLSKDDENDCRSIHKLLSDFPDISLMNPPTNFDPSDIRTEYWEWKDLSNKILNIARWDKYNLARVENSDLVSDWIVDHIQEIYDNLSEEARDCFKFKFHKTTGKMLLHTKSNWHFAMPQMYTILSTMMYHHPVTKEITYRLRKSTGNFPSNYHFKRYIICMSPYHLRGGVPRSNIYHHGMKNWIIKKAAEAGLNLKRTINMDDDDEKKTTIRRGNFTAEEEAFFVEHRAIYCKAVMELYSLMKNMLQKQLGIETHAVSKSRERQLSFI